MQSAIAEVTAFLSANPHLATGAVFLLALSEAVPVVGAVVPGSALIIAIAAMVPSGVVSLWPLLAAAILGAIAGDGLSYWLGHRYGEALLRRPVMRRYGGLVERSKRFFERHGGKGVFLGRFVPGIRAFVPFVAGMLGMPAPRFYAANIASALVWAPAHLLPGLLVGASISAGGPVGARLAIVVAILAVALWLVLWAVRFAVARGVPLVATLRERLWSWSQAGDTWPRRRLGALVDPSRPEAVTLALLAVLGLGAAWLFLGVLEDVVSGDPLTQADRVVYASLQALRAPELDAVMIAVTELGDTAVVAVVAVAVGLWLLARRAWKEAAYWGAAVGVASLLNTGVKVLVHRTRPVEDLYIGWSAFSFPSGHSTVNAALYGFLAFLLAREVRPAARIPVAAALLSFPLLIAFSRVYLGAHWFSDVAGGLAFATAWVLVLGVALVHHGAKPVGPRRLAAVAGVALLLAGGANVYFRHAADVTRYAVRAMPVPSMDPAVWAADGWRALPAYRTDISGEAEEPLVLQWAGDPAVLRERLLLAGWRDPAPWSLAGALAWLSPEADAATDLPILPSANAGRLPTLVLVRKSMPGESERDRRLVLRLWRADLQIDDGLSLWTGSVVEERMWRPLSLASVPLAQAGSNDPRAVLASALPSARLVSRDLTVPGWDGQVLLAAAAMDLAATRAQLLHDRGHVAQHGPADVRTVGEAKGSHHQLAAEVAPVTAWPR